MTGFFSSIKKRFKKDKGNKRGNQPQNDAAQKQDRQQKAIERIRSMQEEFKASDLSKESYDKLKEEKALLEVEAGDSQDAKVAKEQLNEAMKNGEKTARSNEKHKKYVQVIEGQKSTPLETLIKKNQELETNASADNNILPEVENSKTVPPKEKSISDCIKEKILGLPDSIKESVKEAFSSWKDGLNTVYEKLTGILDLGADASGIGGDSGDIQNIKGVIEEITEKDSSGAGITGAVLGGISTVLKCMKTGASIVYQLRRDYKNAKSNAEVIRDSQERFKLSRKYIREIVEIMDGFQGTFAPLTKVIPFYNGIWGLCLGGANMLLDVTDMITYSVHVEQMRRDRNKVYQRIQDKKSKYSKDGRAPDADAAEAYNLGEKGFFTTKSTLVDKKRKELINKLGEEDPNVKLRSRNDTKKRAVQYGLGKNINEGNHSKSEKRQLEALEMMEQYRELDKAHKKMSKAVLHNVEAILTGATGLVGNGLKLAGEIAVASGVGGGVGAGLITAGMATGLAEGGYELARDGVAKGYKGIRTLIGTEDNKATTREDMAIAIMDRMSEIKDSAVWDQTGKKFKDQSALERPENRKDVVRQGRNVEHLHSVLRRGLDVTMSDLIVSKSRKELKEKISGAFGQD